MNTKIFRRFSCLLFLFFPSAVTANLLSTLISSVLIASTFMTQVVTSQICFQNRTELKSAVDDYLMNGQTSNAAQIYGHSIGDWCVKNVTDMSYMFYFAKDFNEDISNWDVSSVTNMNYMFSGTDAFNQDLSSWDVSNVKDMSYMFYDAAAFNGDLSSWNVSNVTSTSYMFYNTAAFNEDISSWDVSNVASMYGMFAYAKAFNGDISSWNPSSATDMSYMFFYAKAFNQDLCAWGIKIQSHTNVTPMFLGSGCQDKGYPNLRSNPAGPFCANCSLAPSSQCST